MSPNLAVNEVSLRFAGAEGHRCVERSGDVDVACASAAIPVAMVGIRSPPTCFAQTSSPSPPYLATKKSWTNM